MALFRRYLYNNQGVVDFRHDKAFQESYEKFREALTSGRFKFIFNKCVCGGTDEYTVFERDRLGVFCRQVICRECGLIRTNPMMDAESTALFYEKFYQDVYHTPPSLARTNEQDFETGKAYARKFIVPFLDLPPGQTIMMIGCGTGSNLYPFIEDGHDCKGVDFCQDKIEYGRLKGLDLYSGHFDVLTGLKKKADVMFLFDVMEHLLDLHTDMAKISNLIKDSGLLVVGLPEIFGTYAYPNGDILFGSLFCHNYWFTRETLINTMGSLGFEYAGKYTYAGYPYNLIATFRKAPGGASTIKDPALSKRVARRIACIEALYRIRKALLINTTANVAASLIRKSPLLLRMARKFLRKDEGA